MALQHPLRRWTLRPLKLNLASSPSTLPALEAMMRQRLPIRRAFSLLPPNRNLDLQTQKQTPLRTFQQQSQTQARRPFHTTKPRSNKSNFNSGYTYQAPNASPSLSQRLKTLSREYGWSALWIYLFLSALDFPFCFAAVKLLGADKIGHYEHVVVEKVKGVVDGVWPGLFEKSKEEKEEEEETEAQAAEKKKRGSEGASLWTQLALAYAIHKSFIFVRVPLTAAITPKVVKQLRKWGWDVLKGKPKAK
ncbi:hypothetical protein BDW59DRAFT_151132 [Aspergillus cavernicola]|uniref:DUF1279 domain-containing protein n=1 Tax=Aspergillus cavernicola TaxID=176166 RepID=A0ABR4HWS0_9EURO